MTNKRREEPATVVALPRIPYSSFVIRHSSLFGGVMDPLRDRYIVLGVCGSIACYKAVDLASRLVKAGAKVDVVMTAGATKFVTPLCFGAITHRPVVDDLWDPAAELAIEHVGLAK